MGSDCCKPSKECHEEQNHTDGVWHADESHAELLIRNALCVVRTIVNPDEEPPPFIVHLAELADRDWLHVVSSLCRAIPLDDAVGPAVILFVLDDCPLPSKDALSGFVDLIAKVPKGDSAYERNLCVTLAYIADRLAGPSAVNLLNSTTLRFLIDRLDYRTNPTTQVILFALIALEKFAQTSENKVTIDRFIKEWSQNQSDSCAGFYENREANGGTRCHPLELLETWVDEPDVIRRQVGFCAQWALDNVFVQPHRDYSYNKTDMNGINAILNGSDASEYLKISPNGLEARGDAASFESVRSTFEVTQGCWYYEAHLITGGIMQIGWATRESNFFNHEGRGVGDDRYSIAYDGCRRRIWHNAEPALGGHSFWKPNDILGCLLDIEKQECLFSLNGVEQPFEVCDYSSIFSSSKTSGLFAAASFTTFQQCRFNFGFTDFLFPPTDRLFKTFNDHGKLHAGLAPIVPRHVRLRSSSIGGTNSCSLCVDLEATMSLEPCGHSGFCEKCAYILENCPLCRAAIVGRYRIPSSQSAPLPLVATPTSDDILFTPYNSNASIRVESSGYDKS